MYNSGIKGFPYYVGINSLDEIATREDRVAVLNIMGSEFEAGDTHQPRLLRRQRGVRHLAGTARSGVADASRRHSRLQQHP